MEDAAKWNEIQHTISEAIIEHETAMAKGIMGPSVVLTIYNKLKAKGFLNEPK